MRNGKHVIDFLLFSFIIQNFKWAVEPEDVNSRTSDFNTVAFKGFHNKKYILVNTFQKCV